MRGIQMSDLLPLGIHFGMSDEDYFADPGHGSNDIKAIVADPVEFQFDRLFGPDDKDTKAIQWGHAIHKRVLEGKQAFDDTYIIKPDPNDYPSLLTTNEELKQHADSMGLPVSGKLTKAKLIKAIRDFDTETPIWQEIEDSFNQKLVAGARTLEPKIRAQVEFAAQWMQRDKMVGAAMENTQFVGGAAEVVYIWERQGVRVKSKKDYLIPESVIDLKSFRPWRNGSLEKGVGNTLGNFRYDIQAVHYEDGWHAGREFFEKGQVFGTPPWPTFLEEVYNRPHPQWVWVFIKSVGAPQTMAWLFPQETEAWQTAKNEIDNGLARYVALRDKYGLDEPWPSEHPINTFYDGLMPAWVGR